MKFPADFVWGAAAASYQIEGAAAVDGRGLCVWDMFSRQPGKVRRNQNGATACDHYHRYREDAALMGQLGMQAYRFSVSWPRVLPEGTGKPNKAGLDFYDKLTDALLENGIQPWLTLFHWDYPYELFCRGGWLSPDSPKWFADYAAIIVDRLSDRVAYWMTQNEPQCFIGLGHSSGQHAPGLKLGFAEVLRAAHNSLLAHGLAVQVIRSQAKTKPLIGAAPAGRVCVPASSDERDIEAARQATFEMKSKSLWGNTWFSDPMILGGYPEDALQAFGTDVPRYTSADMELIKQPLDFYGVNIYYADTVRAAADGGWEQVDNETSPPLTNMDWIVSPECLYWGPRFMYDRYRLPVAVTENGMANLDWVHHDGKVHDPQRIDYLRRHLLQFGRAIQDGVPAVGYLQWSIMDNFEWAHGYKQRFGLVYVDYETGRRIPKDSAWWYRDVIKSHGESLD